MLSHSSEAKRDRNKTGLKQFSKPWYRTVYIQKTWCKKGKSSTFDEIVKLVLKILKASTKEYKKYLTPSEKGAMH